MINAVAYVRMSSDKQEASPKQQREEITKLAKREGYRIIRWYTDEAISGDATEKLYVFRTSWTSGGLLLLTISAGEVGNWVTRSLGFPHVFVASFSV